MWGKWGGLSALPAKKGKRRYGALFRKERWRQILFVEATPPAHNDKHTRMVPKGPTRLSTNARIPISLVWLRRV